MAKKRKYPKIKTQTVEKYQKLFNKSKAAYLINFSGTSVEDFTNIRKNLNSVGGSLKVLKNRLAKIAIIDSPFSKLGEYLTKDNAVVLSSDNVVSTAKVLGKHAKEINTIKIINGILVDDKDNILTEKDIIKISSLPSREVLIAQLLGTIYAPVVQLVRTLNEPIRSLAQVLNMISQKSYLKK